MRHQTPLLSRQFSSSLKISSQGPNYIRQSEPTFHLVSDMYSIENRKCFNLDFYNNLNTKSSQKKTNYFKVILDRKLHNV